jgi:hypothetical protein
VVFIYRRVGGLSSYDRVFLAFRDMGHKFRDWRHALKKPMKITDDDSHETVRARMAPDFVGRYNPLDIDTLLDKWCSKKNKVGHDQV